MPNKVPLLLALFLALAALWSSDANPSVDMAQAAVEEYVVFLQRSLDMQDTSGSRAATDIFQELQRKQQDISASAAAANTSKSNQQQQQQQRQQQHDSRGGEAEAQALTAKMELAAVTSGAHNGKEEVFPSLPPPEEQDRDYIWDESDAQTSARLKKEAARRASQQATQEAAKQAAPAPQPIPVAASEPATAAPQPIPVEASEPAPAPQPLPVTAPAPEPRLSHEDANYQEDQDNVHEVPVGMVLNFNEKLHEDKEKFRQAEQKESSSLVQRLRLELDLEHARQEAEAAQRAAAEEKGVFEVADSHSSAVASDAEKAAELHTLAFEVYNKTLNGTYEEWQVNTQNMSAEEIGTKARHKVLGQVVKGAQWMMGSNATKKKDMSKDPQVLELHTIAFKADHLEERLNQLTHTLNRSQTKAKAKLVHMELVEEAKLLREDLARKKLEKAAAEADETIASVNQIAFGAIEEAESFITRLMVDPAGELKAAAGPGLKLAVVPLLILSWAAAVAL